MSTRIKVIHPEIGEVSLALGSRYYGDDSRDHVEVAFFDRLGKWYTAPVIPFEKYADCEPSEGVTRVFGHVPYQVVETWLAIYGNPTDIKAIAYKDRPKMDWELR